MKWLRNEHQGLRRVWRKAVWLNRILVGLVLGVFTGMDFLSLRREAVGLLGTLFVGALKSGRPVLVLMLVANGLDRPTTSGQEAIFAILFLYLLGTFQPRWQLRCVQLRLPFNAASVE